MVALLLYDLKEAARGANPEAAVRAILAAFVRDPESARAAFPDYDEDDVILYEDDTVSIWFCRFQPGMTVPPHDHRMSATIAVFQGVEQNDLYDRNGDHPPVFNSSTPIPAGAVVHIPADAVHGVTCTSDIPSQAIHVYLGALSSAERSLFDPKDGAEMPFTDENYHRLTQSQSS